MSKDRVFIERLQAMTVLGIHEEERQTPRLVLVSISAFTETPQAARTDEIHNCVDYARLSKEIRTFLAGARRFTVEALAEDIAQLCLAFPSVTKVMVKVEKPGAVADTGSVGVEIERP